MRWIKCSERLPENTGDPIIFRKNWNYATAKAMIPISVAAIMGIFNDKLKYIEWLDENDHSDEEAAFNAARLREIIDSKVNYNGEISKVKTTGFLKYPTFQDYQAELNKK